MSSVAAIRIYDSLSGRKEIFKPLNPPEVKIYVCGLTPYDKPHLGHVLAMVRFNVIRSYLNYRGFKVRFVENVTDIDDKIIARSLETGEDPYALGKRYSDEFFQLMTKMREPLPDVVPRVTEYVPQIIAYIERLITGGSAYVTPEGNVYFEVSKKADYGKLSNQNIAELYSGVRKDNDQYKKHPGDFALWKRDEKSTLSSPSPWGIGRPGWHIECSVMIDAVLGKTIDIHGGGMDLKFPHHENEIAQSEAANGCALANYWLHSGLLTVNGEKMSKSLGNFLSFDEALDKYGAELIRFVILRHHYRSNIDLSDDLFLQNLNNLLSLYRVVDRADRVLQEGSMPTNEEEAGELRRKFEEAMDEDFNFPLALVALEEGVAKLNGALEAIENQKKGAEPLTQAALSLRGAIKELGGVLGLLQFSTEEVAEAGLKFIAATKGGAIITEDEIQSVIAARQTARKEKDFAAADKIRKELEGRGVALLDRAGGGSEWMFLV